MAQRGSGSAPRDKRQDKKKQLQVAPGRFRLDIWENFFTRRLVRHWDRLPRAVEGSLSLEVLNKHPDVALHNQG